jgi:hypothetical protein
MSPIAASSAAAVTKLTPGSVSSRRISAEASTCATSARSISASSPSEGDLAQAGRDRLLLVGRQLLRGQPAPPADAEEIAHRRLALQVADQPRVHLILGPGALPHQLRPRRDPPAQDPRLLVRQPDRRQEAAGEQLRERARVNLVGLRAARVIPFTAFGFANTTRPTCGSMIRAIWSALPVASSATSSSPPRLCANSSSAAGSLCTRPASRTAPASAIATSQKSRCTSKPMNRIRHHPHSRS